VYSTCHVMRSLTYEMNREFGGLGVVQEKRSALYAYPQSLYLGFGQLTRAEDLRDVMVSGTNVM